jgi:PKHD-type hydroxylase
MNQIWQYWEGTLSPSYINSILDTSEKYEWSSPGLGFNGETQNNEYRKSKIKWVPPLENPYIRDMVWNFAMQANKHAFGFDLSFINDIQYTEYHSVDQGKYDWHQDTFWANPTCFDRKISVVIQLDDPEDYDGGDFLIDPAHPQPDPIAIKRKGSVIVFPSFINHCVTPVTRGRRRSLVSWVEGPKFR